MNTLNGKTYGWGMLGIAFAIVGLLVVLLALNLTVSNRILRGRWHLDPATNIITVQETR